MTRLLILSLMLLTAYPVLAQHRGRSGPNQTNRSGDRRDHSHFIGNHHQIDRSRDIRVIHGHQQVYFGGFWFVCDYFPEWVFIDDIYVVQLGENYYIYDYRNPSDFVEVQIIL